MSKSLVGKFLFVFLASTCAASIAHAGSIKDCGSKGPSKSTGEYDHFRDAKIKAVAGQGTVFQNNEGILPRVGQNQTYYEYDLGKDGLGGRGAHRAVLLVQKSVILNSYFSQDHYASFCRI
jgi:hypothetical protein